MKRIIASGGIHEFEGWVADDAELDGAFVLTEDDGTRMRLNGWLFAIETVVESPRTELTPIGEQFVIPGCEHHDRPVGAQLKLWEH